MHAGIKLFMVMVISVAVAACAKKEDAASRERAATPPPVTAPDRPQALPTSAPASGFDIGKVPVVTPQLGKFPYFGLIDGYRRDESPANKDVAFDLYEFFDGTKIVPIEGRLTTIAAEGQGASAHQVLKTYQSLVTGLGGVKVFEGKGEDMARQNLKFSELRHRLGWRGDQMGIYAVRMPDKEIWVEAYVGEYNKRGEPAHGRADNYFLTVVEKKALEVKASLLPADQMKKELDTKGHVALYINFDFDKADIKPDSQPIIDEVVKLLRTEASLKLTIEGHTDNVGAPDYNKRLSDARARSVVAALVSRGIQSGRLTATGYGQEKPIADNNTDEGRAKNRRVELVKM